ncbi:EpsG family protein [Marinobacter algicola]|uniref:EpsG family protein n=1 Tax=Marinobacter algicola TaxID=236100 RepID=UPI0002F7789D|nr:EpsG family protein [Marinobacter algicola]
MSGYLIILFYATLLLHFVRRYGGLGVQKLGFFVVALMLILFAGFRDKSVGTDTINYIGFLEKVLTVDDIFEFKLEPGFNALVLLSGQLSDTYLFLLICIASIVVFCYFYTAIRLTRRYETAVFVFIAFGTYTFFFNGARQGIAAAICFFALPKLLERRALSYLALVSLATLFHASALVALPLYFLATRRVGCKEILFIVFSVIVVSIFLSSVAQVAGNLINAKYASYGEGGQGGGYVQVAFLFAQGVLLFLFKSKVDDSKGYYARLLNIYLIGLVPALASIISGVNPSGILRLTVYFSHAAILLWPMTFLSFSNKQAKILFSFIFVVVAIAYFVLTTTNFSNLVPFNINSELV